MKQYYVTAFAGAFVAGVANPGVGKPLYLNDKQAEHELRLGSLTETPPEPEKAAKPKAE